MAKNSQPLTNENDDSIVNLCNPKTGEIMAISTRHSPPSFDPATGARRNTKIDALLAQGWRPATDDDRELALAQADENAQKASS